MSSLLVFHRTKKTIHWNTVLTFITFYSVFKYSLLSFLVAVSFRIFPTTENREYYLPYTSCNIMVFCSRGFVYSKQVTPWNWGFLEALN